MSESLEEIKAKRAALAEARALREKAAQELAEIEAEKQGLIDDEALEKAEAEFGSSYYYGEEEPARERLAVVKTPYGSIILKRAEPIIWSRFTRTGKTDEKSLQDLVGPSLLHPEKIKFYEILEEKPMVLTMCASAIAELAGARSAEIQKKS